MGKVTKNCCIVDSVLSWFLFALLLGTGLLCLFFYLLCYAAVLKFLTYYAQYYVHVETVLLEYIHLYLTW